MKDTAPYSITERESKTLEFKIQLPKLQTIIKTCVAFANGSGGRIIVGVDDASHEVIGVSEEDRDRIYDEVPNCLYDAVQPTIMPQIYEKRYGDRSTVIIEIYPGSRKPHFIKSEGYPKGVYVRIGSSTRRANADHVEDLTRESRGLHFDEEPVNASSEILSEEFLKRSFGRSPSPKQLLGDKILARDPHSPEHYQPTVAGTLSFCEEPEKYIPEALIRCTLFDGVEGRDIIKTLEIKGPISTVATEALHLIISWTKRHYTLDGALLKGKLLIPEEALREGIINALIHRKYTVPGPIKIAVFDDRCEIFSPGCFPGLVEHTSLGDGVTFLRNPTLVKLARKMSVVESLGTGIRLIIDSCTKAGLPHPEFIEGADYVKLILRFPIGRPPHLSDDEAILYLTKAQGSTSTQEVAEYLKVSKNTASRKLRKLLLKNLLKKHGKGPSTRYTEHK